MAIITIARELAALGEEVARELSRITDYKLIDREYLEKRLSDYGLDAGKGKNTTRRSPAFGLLSPRNGTITSIFSRPPSSKRSSAASASSWAGAGRRSSRRSRASWPSSSCLPWPCASSA